MTCGASVISTLLYVAAMHILRTIASNTVGVVIGTGAVGRSALRVVGMGVTIIPALHCSKNFQVNAAICD